MTIPLNQILHHFHLKKKFPRMNNNFFTKSWPRGPTAISLRSEYSVLIDFIAILLTPGIFLIQIVNTNNTNMYLINFHRKNIVKMHFPPSFFLKFQSYHRHSLSIATC